MLEKRTVKERVTASGVFKTETRSKSSSSGTDTGERRVEEKNVRLLKKNIQGAGIFEAGCDAVQKCGRRNHKRDY